MKKTKYLKLLGFGFLAATTTSLLLSACSKLEPAVVVGLPFGVDEKKMNPQGKVFSELYKKYNDYVQKNHYDANANTYKDGYLPLRLQLSNSYGENRKLLLANLRSNTSLPNLSFGYGNEIFNIQSASRNNDLLFDFSQAENGGFTINKDMFLDSFLKPSNLISGVNPNATYLLPTSISTEMLYTSKVAMHYLLKEALKNNVVTIKTEDKEFFKTQFGVDPDNNDKAVNNNSIYKPKDSKLEVAKQYFGTFKKQDSNNSNKYEVSKKIFTHVEDLLKFTGHLIKNLSDFQENKAFDNKVLIAISQGNFYQIYSFIKNGADFSEYLWIKDANGQYNYDIFQEKSNSSNPKLIKLKEIYNMIYDNVGKYGALWSVQGPGSDGWPSNDFKKINMLFTISSSTGFGYHYDTEANNKQLEQDDILVLPAPFLFDNTTSKGAYWVQGGSMFGIKHKDETINKATRLFLKWFFTSQEIAFEVKNGNNKTETKQVTPALYYSLKSNYLPGMADFYKQTQYQGIDQKNWLKSPTIKIFQEFFNKFSTQLTSSNDVLASTNNEFSWGLPNNFEAVSFAEPAGQLSNNFRNFANSYNKNTKNQMRPFSEWWDTLIKDSIVISYFKNKQ